MPLKMKVTIIIWETASANPALVRYQIRSCGTAKKQCASGNISKSGELSGK
jgi:hypothetical protein